MAASAPVLVVDQLAHLGRPGLERDLVHEVVPDVHREVVLAAIAGVRVIDEVQVHPIGAHDDAVVGGVAHEPRHGAVLVGAARIPGGAEPGQVIGGSPAAAVRRDDTADVVAGRRLIQREPGGQVDRRAGHRAPACGTRPGGQMLTVRNPPGAWAYRSAIWPISAARWSRFGTGPAGRSARLSRSAWRM